MSDKLAKIKELKELLDGGAVTQEEFEAEKKVILEGGYETNNIQPVAAQAGSSIVINNNTAGAGFRAHKYDASILSGKWFSEVDHCPGCCPPTRYYLTITSMGDDAFELEVQGSKLQKRSAVRGQKYVYTRQGATDNFHTTAGGGHLCIVVNENQMRISGPRGNFTLNREVPIERTAKNQVAPVPEVMA